MERLAAERFVAPALLAGALFSAGCSRTYVTTATADQSSTGLAVSGVGKVQVRPDTLSVSLIVVSRAGTAEAALADVSRDARALIDAIRKQGVEEADVRTTGLRLEPRFGPGETIEGYEGQERFRVKVRDLERAGDVVGAAVHAAGDAVRVSGMSLQVADPEAAADQARAAAAKDAVRRAKSLAAAAGVRIGAPLSIEEIESPEGIAFALPSVAATGSGGGAEAIARLAPEIEAGVQDVVVRVLVRFRIGG